VSERLGTESGGFSLHTRPTNHFRSRGESRDPRRECEKMLMADDMSLTAFHKKWMHNRNALREAAICGCFYCLEEFSADQIAVWVDNDDTALCPFCGIDSVLGFSSEAADKMLLNQMHDRWFTRTTRL
jgi:hypothetical protein